MRLMLAAGALATLLGAVPAMAQSEADHRVQRAWDDVFHPPPPGDPRTNYERRRDNYRYRVAQHDRWCRAHPGASGCGRYSSRY